MTNPRHWIDAALYFLTAVLLPNIFLFDLYNRNHLLNHLPFGATLIIGVILAVTSIAVFVALRWLTRSLEGALALTLVFWLGFWFFEQTHALLFSYPDFISRLIWFGFINGGLVFIAACLRQDKLPLGKIRPAFRALAGVLCLMFIFNFFPGAQRALVFSEAVMDSPERGTYIKREFYIDPALPRPDIYWFHMDGMLSLEKVERFFGEPQDHLRYELERRGFVIYREAELNAGHTALAMPALFSPSFYDNYWGRQLYEVRHLLNIPRTEILVDRLINNGIDLINDVMQYHEIIHALMDVGYEIANISANIAMQTITPFNRFYDLVTGNMAISYSAQNIYRQNRFQADLGDLMQLLFLTTPLSMAQEELDAITQEIEWIPTPDHSYWFDHLTYNTQNFQLERYFYNTFFDSLLYTVSPRFVFATFLFSHGGHWVLQDPSLLALGFSEGAEIAFTRIDLYMPAHNYAVMVMLNSIDIVLSENPNAVIVLQSDHGFHAEETQDFMLASGYPKELILELNHSVFSAVRIPEAYGGLDAPLAPLNISRELVNRFVGWNYELLPRSP